MRYVNRIPVVINQLRDGLAQGLAEAVAALQAAVQTKLAAGFTTGAFTTGEMAASALETTPVTEEGGELNTALGTNNRALIAWELGHINLFTRRYERVPHITNAAVEEAEALGLTLRAALGGIR